MNLTLRYGIGAVGCAALLLTACPGPKPGETDSGDASTGDMTGGMSTTSGGATTGGTPTTTDAMSGTQGGTDGGSGDMMTTNATTTATTATTTSAGSTGGEVPPELLDACNAACAKFFECINPPPFPDVAECVQGCVSEGNGDPMCETANTAFADCIAGLDCPALQNAIENEDFGACNDEFMQVDMLCVPCESYGGVGEPDGCLLGQQCPNMPSIEISCMGDTCTCLVDDVQTGECPANGVCAQPDGSLAMLAQECCGFEL